MGDGPLADSCAAVVGADGFLGTALSAALLAGGVRVRRFTRDRPCLSGTGRISAGLAEAQTVFWAMSTVNPALAETRPEGISADHGLFAAVLDALATTSGCRRVILLSSGGTVYDPALPPPYSETAPTRPRGAYGAAKLALEARLAEAGDAIGSGVSMRISNAYGPGQPAAPGQGVIAHWLNSAAYGGPLRILGAPTTTRDYVHVEDIVRALVAVHHHQGALPATLNVGSGLPTTLAELADIVLAVVDDPALTVQFRAGRPFDVARTWLDTSLTRRVLGWTPEITLPGGVRQTWRELRSSGATR